MARQRINSSFLITLGAGVLLVCVSVGAMWLYHGKPHNPAQLIATGDEAIKKRDYATAAGNYMAASELLPKRADLHLKAGECCYQLTAAGFDRFQQALDEFNKAASLDPSGLAAYAGMIKTNELAVGQLEGRNLTDAQRETLTYRLGQMQDAATHIAKIEPNNSGAQAARAIMTIRIWRSNLAMPETPEERTLPPGKRMTADKRGEAAIDDLTRLMADHPEDEKIPLWIANGKIYEGKQVLRLARKGSASTFFADAATAFDQDIAAKPDLVPLYMGKAQILQQLFQIDSTPGTNYLKQLHDTVEVAQGKVDFAKSPEDYRQAKFAWCRVLRSSDITGSEDILHDLIKKFPDELPLRVLLAKDLHGDRGRDSEALAVLDEIATLPGPPVTELELRNRWDQQAASAKLIRADIELDELDVTPSGEARGKLIKDIGDSIDSSQKRFGGTSTLLTLQGHLQLLLGQKKEAVDTLTQAVEKMKLEGSAPDYKLLRIEASAYSQAGQNNKAIAILESQMRDPVYASNPDVHFALADMCLQNQDFARAKLYIDWLAERMPKDTRVIRFQIDELGPTPTFESIEKLYNQLPEAAPSDLAVKCNYALKTKNYDDAIRLLTSMNKLFPNDIGVAVKLADLLVNQNRTPEALVVLEACGKLNPDNGTIKLNIAKIKGATPDELAADSIEQIKLMKDDFDRERSYVRFYQSRNKPDEMLKHLLEAVKLQPDDKQTLSTLFLFYLQNRRFPEAQAMLPHLIELDVDDAHGMIFQIKLALAMNDPQKAIALGQKFTHDSANFAGSWELYGEALQANRQLSLACEQYRQALLLQSTNTEALNRLIDCSVAQHKLVEARADLAEACKRFPSDPNYRAARQKFEIQYGDAKSILPELDDQIQQHPADPVGYAMDIDALDACVHTKARESDASSAADLQQKEVARYKEAVLRWPEEIRFSNGLAQVYAKANKLPDAEKVLEAIAHTNAWKDKASPLVLLGQIYLSASKLDQAEKCLKQALEVQHDSPEALLSLADCKQKQNDAESALAVLQPHLSDFNIRAKYTGILMQYQERWPQAELEVSDALKADPTDSQMTNLLLYVYYGEQKRDQGLALASAAMDSPRPDVYLYMWRAKLLMLGSTPDREGAGKDLNRFLDAIPGSAEGHLLMSELVDSKGDREGAISELGTALSLNPQDRQIRLTLLSKYLTSNPPHTSDAEQLLTSTLAMPAFSSDPDFEARLALILVQKKEKDNQDKAVTLMQKAMLDASNKKVLVRDYFNVLLIAKNNDLLLTESAKYLTDPNCPYFIYSDRGVAKAAIGDLSGAVAEFNIALDRAGAELGRNAALTVTQAIAGSEKLGVAKAIELVLPRAKDSPMWQLVASELLVTNHDTPGATRQAEAAMASIDKLEPHDQYHLLEIMSSLYITAAPPVVDKALAIYMKILKIAPTNIDAMNDVACIFVDMSTPQNPSEALVWSQKAYDLCTKTGQMPPRVADTQGWVLIQNGKVSEGIDVLHRAIDKADFPEAHYHLAMGYIAKKELPAARLELDVASQMVKQKHEQHLEVDETLPAKIEAALKQAEKADGVKPDAKSASSGR